MGIKCPKCQFDNPDTQKFCGECGTQLKAVYSETKTLRTSVKDSTVGEIISEKYKLLEELGSGGMGVVYKAEQIKPVKRNVALKIIKLGMDTKQVVARFETERQALAVMDHPNIAKVFDGGATETGRPYFVMEIVRGLPITEYCDKQKLTTRERLELLTQVCQAIQHAHQKGVIHRDLKPSNILVVVQEDKPVPKIIDFGIAKAIEHRLTERTLFTEQGQLIGTPEYMSPEQAEMSGLDVDTRTDIYSLGVMLYELLVGVLPFDPETLRSASFGEIQRIIRDEEPSKASTRISSLGDTQTSIAEHRKTDPSSLSRELKGDLDWITAMAMAKDRTQRYASVSELEADIRRYLRQEPVTAGPPSTVYRIRKYINRHKIGVVSTIIILLAVLIGIAGTTVGLIRATKAERAATREATKARAINEFLQEILGSANPIEGAGSEVTVITALGRALPRIDESFANQPEIKAAIQNTIGMTYHELGRLDEAERLYRSAIAVHRNSPVPEHPDLATSLNNLAELLAERADYEAAENLHRKALVMRRKLLGDEHQDVAESLNNLALLLQRKGDYDAAEPLYRESLQMHRKLLGEDHQRVALVLGNLALLLRSKGDYEAAEPLAREALALHRKLLGNEHPFVATSMNALALLLQGKGDYEAAEPLYREALALRRKLFGGNHPDVGQSLINLANMLRKKGDYEGAEPFFKEVTGTDQKIFDPDHWALAYARSLHAACLTKLGRFEQAEELLFAAHSVLQAKLGEQHRRTLQATEFLVELYEAWNKPEKAAEYRALLKRNELKE